MVFFRLVAKFPPTALDFLTHQALNPTRDYKAKGCESRSLSVFADVKGAIDIQKLPTQRGKLIAKLPLTAAAGVHKQTGARRDHHSWWLYRAFDPIPICELVSLSGEE